MVKCCGGHSGFTPSIKLTNLDPRFGIEGQSETMRVVISLSIEERDLSKNLIGLWKFF